MNYWSHLSWTLQDVPWIRSSGSMHNFWHNVSRYSIALNVLFTACTLSPAFLNFLCSLQPMEPMPSQVRNDNSQKNHEAHLEGTLGFKKTAKLHCPSNDCIPMICICTSYCGWLMTPTSLVKQDVNTDREIAGGKTEDTAESTVSSDIEADNFDLQQHIQLLGKVRWDKSFQTTRVPLRMKQSSANAIIVHPPLRNSPKLPGSMAPPPLKCQK